MRKVDKRVEKAVLRLLDNAAGTFGLSDVRRAANKWSNGQRAKASLAKAQRKLELQLADVNRKLRN